MNDFEYDCWQKKILAKQAKHKKNGSKSKRCTFESDRLTRKQWEQKCGPVITYNLNVPVTLDLFESWPANIQQSYINGLTRKYNVSFDDIANLLTVDYRYFIEHQLLTTNGITYQSEEDKKNWEEFLMQPVQTLPTDPLAEDYPIDWKTFRSLDIDTQTEMLRHWRQAYGATLAVIAKMFGVSSSSVSKYIKNHGIKVAFPGGAKMSLEEQLRWAALVSKSTKSITASEGSEEVAEPESLPDEDATAQVTFNNPDNHDPVANKTAKVRDFKITFEGNIQLDDIMQKLVQLVGNDITGKLKIEFDPD